ncbi:MAG: diaminopimelate epimerase [Patescibacteria group bacterium]|nr:diaminopimelate epimerase [Patescibacteria group bacterium]
MINFYKYHGAGNDFIMIDNRDGNFDVKNKDLVKLLCHRRFGIGADGIILVENDADYDFRMVFMNNDGSIGAMCGNGGRCIVHFAYHILKIVKDPKNVEFIAVDGKHQADIDGDIVKLKMQDIESISTRNNLPYICQGTTPHNIQFVTNLKDFPVFETGRKIRYLDESGVNVNFVELIDGVFHVRTYERGVEDETLACGTGATSVAIAVHNNGMLKENVAHIKMPGGDLKVSFEKMPDDTYQNIWLTGEAKCVFEGEWE